MIGNARKRPAVVIHNLLISLDAVVLRWLPAVVCGGSAKMAENLVRWFCGGCQNGGCDGPPYPYTLGARFRAVRLRNEVQVKDRRALAKSAKNIIKRKRPNPGNSFFRARWPRAGRVLLAPGIATFRRRHATLKATPNRTRRKVVPPKSSKNQSI